MIATVVTVILFTLVCFAVFGLFEWLVPIDDHQKPILRRDGLKTDLWYWFCEPLWGKVGGVIVIIVFLLFVSLMGWEATKESLSAGFGPMARLPVAWQIIGSLIVADIAEYWTHRFFHTVRMWKFHAIHHSPEDLDWLAAARLHPVNSMANKIAQALSVVMLGFPPMLLAARGTIFILWNLLIHANVNWTFGWPLKYVLASPVFHRWHHTTQEEAQGKNFAGMFPFIDLLFGTFYMPAGKRPLHLGIGEEKLPDSYLGQLLYPFRKSPAAGAGTAEEFDRIAAAAEADGRAAAHATSDRPTPVA